MKIKNGFEFEEVCKIRLTRTMPLNDIDRIEQPVPLVGCARLSLQLQVPQWVHQKFYCDLFKAAISCQTMAGIQCSPTRAMLSTHPPARRELASGVC